MSILNKFIDIEDKINKIVDVIDNKTNTESQRKNAFIEYKAYLDKVKEKMIIAKETGDKLIVEKADEILIKINSCLNKFGHSMNIGNDTGAANAQVDSSKKDSKLCNTLNNSSSGLNNFGDKVYFIVKSDFTIISYKGSRQGLSNLINRDFKDDISKGDIPKIYEGTNLKAKTKIVLDF